MNFNSNVNAFQRGMNQNCFKCEGDGKVFPFEGKRGIGSTCNACNGNKVIDGSCTRCLICKGCAKCYPFEGNKGIPTDCKACVGLGYVTQQLDLCNVCNGEGKEYPFPGKRGIASECKRCLGKGGLAINNNYNNNSQYQQPQNYNQNSQYKQPQNFNQNSQYQQPQNFNQNSQYQQQNFNQNSQYNNSIPIQDSNYYQQIYYDNIETTNKLSSFHAHQLMKIMRSYICNVCNNEYSNSASYFCGACDLDVCDGCASRICKKFEKKEIHFQHYLAPTIRDNQWNCNGCGNGNPSGNISWYCGICDFDVCVICFYP